MIALLLAAVVAGGVGRTLVRPAPIQCVAIEAECVREVCSTECWTVHVRYVVNLAPEEAPPDWRTRAILDGGLWGNREGAECHARHVVERGVWVERPDEPGAQMLLYPSDATVRQILEFSGHDER